ncbi:body wall muscle protein HR-29 isoform X2 [Lepeophtheirus salmonis]|uniref:SHSP domain-containing protein n=1 Tax=Lepeophtheirus salmonis TaxID=72036 RepID=A0A0K2TXI6_LEPSM|nr:body wall muscle protein HR-29-like isoform X2 [Lepeophtheirus salmonis]
MSDKKVPIRMGEFSVLDTEFGSMKDKFDEEMKRMENVMDRFRGDMLDKDSNFFSHSSSSSSNTSGNDMLRGSGLGTHTNWISGIDSSLNQEGKQLSEQKDLKLRFDVSSYLPEEIMVKTVDNKLMVHAKHEEKADGKSSFRQYNREFLLPEGTDPELIKSSLSKEGILTVEAPLPQPAIENRK